ncbi:MAG: molybdopterin-dependent oxidoreductase [Acidobacteria bacterium]|nr:molybdopterin-dependent oxidoreductase [Acidobacteriota bacterium]
MSEKELIHLTINGQSVAVPKGTVILEAAKTAGIHIPHYCYHPGLSCVGSCRMCLVEIEKSPKLQPSCATPAAEGMVVSTETPETLKNRRSVLEFLLANHPLDCPVCDQAGECELQNYYMDHGRYDARFSENKAKKKKAYPIGPHIISDQERCILCTRCVRFTQEISKTFELGVIDRGHRSAIDIFPGNELNNHYSGNLADVCPVGALTDRDFRFKCRVWFLGKTNSICPGCSRGCNIEIHFNERFNPRYHQERVQRLKPRYNKEVNGHWICDEGRYAYHSIDAENRLCAPSLERGEDPPEVSWEEAVRSTAKSVREIMDKHGPAGIAVLASPQMTNEELFGIRRLFQDHLKIEDIEFRVPPGEESYSDDILITADKNPNSKGAEILIASSAGARNLLQACSEGRIHLLYIFHHDLTLSFYSDFVSSALEKVDRVIFQGSWNNPTAALADTILPAAVYAEKDGTYTNIEGRVQRIRAAVPPVGRSRPDLDIIAQLAEELGVTIHKTPASAFEEIARSVDVFSGMTYATVGDSGQLLKQESGN